MLYRGFATDLSLRGWFCLILLEREAIDTRSAESPHQYTYIHSAGNRVLGEYEFQNKRLKNFFFPNHKVTLYFFFCSLEETAFLIILVS